MDKIKLEKFFEKFSINELDLLRIIFSYVKDYDMSLVEEIFNKVYTIKFKPYDEEFSVPLPPFNYSLLNLTSKINELNKEELNYLYDLVSDASLYLSSIQSYQDVYINVIEDFDIKEYPIHEMDELESALYDQINNKKVKKLSVK